MVAINDLGDAATNAHLLQYDTAHGKFGQTVSVEGIPDGRRSSGQSVGGARSCPIALGRFGR